jgi:hypothetical protein
MNRISVAQYELLNMGKRILEMGVEKIKRRYGDEEEGEVEEEGERIPAFERVLRTAAASRQV